jgi:hypothetical protein
MLLLLLLLLLLEPQPLLLVTVHTSSSSCHQPLSSAKERPKVRRNSSRIQPPKLPIRF